MSITLPRADDRSFASLVADAYARLPRLAPGWTDYNLSDPGITLIELLAQRAESDLYWLSRVTPEQRRAFLRWFGLEARGPRVADTVVALAPRAGASGAPVAVAADVELTSRAGDVGFCTQAALALQPAGIVALFTGDRRGYESASAVPLARLEGSAAALLGPNAADACVIAFDRALADEVSLYFASGAAEEGRRRWAYIKEESAALGRELPPNPSPCAARLADFRRHHDVDLVWEAYTAAGWTVAADVVDETRALSLSGFVRLRVPAMQPLALSAALNAYALRVRVQRGRYETPPAVQAVLLNAVPVQHVSSSFSLQLGPSNGRAGQRFAIADLPREPKPTPNPAASPPIPAPGAPLVFAASELAVTAQDGVASERFALAPDWDRAGADEPVAVLDPELPQLSFGDGRRGRVPPAGARIDFVSRVGGGDRGNIAAGTLTRARDSALPFAVVQPFPARGGAPAPAPSELQVELLARLARVTRGVSLSDFETLALATPFAEVARAHAVAEYHPDLPGLAARGCVALVVIPRAPGSRPEPSPGFLRAVRAYLERRRVLTTELHVLGPSYLELSVHAQLVLEPDADAAAVLAAASAAIDAFFHPLTGGPDANGWPLGRDVYRSEVLALLQSLVAVHHVEDLALLHGSAQEPACGNVEVCPTDLITTLPHALTIAPTRMS